MKLKFKFSYLIFLIGRYYYYKLNFSKAEKWCHLALKIYQKNEVSCVKLARLYDRTKKFSDGICYWCKAFVYSDKKNKEAYHRIIKDIVRLKLLITPEEAIERYFDNDIKKNLIVSKNIIDFNRVILYKLILNKVNILFKNKQYAEAKTELTEMFIYDFNSIKYIVNLLPVKKYGKQFNYFILAESIQYLPNDTNIMNQLLDIYFLIDKNLIQYDFVDNLIKKHYMTLYNAEKIKTYPVGFLNKCIKLFPDDVIFYNELMKLYVAERNIIERNNLLQLAQKNIQNNLDLAQLASIARDYSLQEKCYVNALQYNQNDLNVIVTLGDFLDARGRINESLEYCEKALQISNSKNIQNRIVELKEKLDIINNSKCSKENPFLPQLIDKIFEKCPRKSYEAVEDRLMIYLASISNGGGGPQKASRIINGLLKQTQNNISVLTHDNVREGMNSLFAKKQSSRLSINERICRAVNSLNENETYILNDILPYIKYLPKAKLEDILGMILNILKDKPKILHCFGTNELAIYTIIAGILCNVQKIILNFGMMKYLDYGSDYETDIENELIYRTIYKHVIKHPNVVFVNNSDAAVQSYRDWLGFKKNQIIKVLNGIELYKYKFLPKERKKIRKELKIDDNTLLIGMIGRVMYEKLPNLWLDIAIELLKKYDNIKFIWLGEGNLRNIITQKVKSLNLNDKIQFLGNKSNIPAWYSSMDLILFTSQAEGLPNALAEAQACGLPVVSMDAGGAKETFVEGKSGFCAQTNTKEELIKLASFAIDHPEWRKNAKNIAIEYANKTFQIDRMVADTLKIYASK